MNEDEGDRALLGECLMRTRLALTALALWNGAEAQAVLAALCRDLVAAGVVDPMESAVGGDTQ